MSNRIGTRILGRETSALLVDPRVLILCGSFTTAIMFGALLSPALPEISDQFSGASKQNVGWVLTIQTLFIVLSLPVVGVLTDRVGPRRILPMALTSYAILGVACAFAPNFRSLLALRALQGVAYAGVIPVVTTLVSQTFHGDIEATVQGLLSTTTGVAGILYPAIGGMLVEISWRSTFLFYGSLLPLAYLAKRHFRSEQDSHYNSASTIGRVRRSIDQFGTRHLLAFSLGFTVFYLRLAIIAYLPFLALTSFDATPLEVGALLTSIGVLKMVSSSQIHRILQVVPISKQSMIGIGLSFAGASLVVLGFSRSFLWMMIGLSLFGISYGVTLPLNRSLLTSMTDAEHRGMTFALLSVMNNFGKTAAPITVGVLLASGLPIHDSFIVVGGGAVGLGGMMAVLPSGDP